MTIEIICPIYNAEQYLEELHNSFLFQENVNIKNIRYILTKSVDNTEKILKSLDNCIYTIIDSKDFSHSLTREQEALKSEADIIVFVTQDVKIKRKDWLYNLVKDIEISKVDATYSRQICDNDFIEKYTREKNYPEKSSIVSKEDIKKLGLRTFFFSDASSAIKNDTFRKLNGYDNKKMPTNEDMYIAYKLIMNDYKIEYCADSEVIHSHNFTLKQLYSRYKLIGKFFKKNTYLNEYKVKSSGGNLAIYILKRAIEDKNFKVLFRFLPDMIVRYVGMEIGKNK